MAEIRGNPSDPFTSRRRRALLKILSDAGQGGAADPAGSAALIDMALRVDSTEDEVVNLLAWGNQDPEVRDALRPLARQILEVRNL